MDATRAVVLSDLHLGPQAGEGTQEAEDADERADALCGLLRWLEVQQPCELVLAGDVFDFLAVPGYDDFASHLAAKRFETICGPDHRPPGATRRVPNQLGQLLERPRSELTVLSGNHDPELLHPEVRQRFEQLVGRVGSVRWAHDDEPLARNRPARPEWALAFADRLVDQLADKRPYSLVEALAASRAQELLSDPQWALPIAFASAHVHGTAPGADFV